MKKIILQNFCFMLFVFIIFTIVFSCDNKSNNSVKVNQEQEIDCYPDIYMYQGYDHIVLITASIEQDIELASKKIVGYGNIENYKKWRESSNGCCVMYYFYKIIIDDYNSDYYRVEFSDIYKNEISVLTPEYLYKQKDEFTQIKINNGGYPIDYEIVVIDGDYSVASDVRQNSINYSSL